MSVAASLIRESRRAAGLTQAELARRMGVSQPTVAAWERPGSNPTVRTLERALGASGRRLEAGTRAPIVDPSLVREHRRLSPGERLRVLESLQRDARAFARARRVRDDRR